MKSACSRAAALVCVWVAAIVSTAQAPLGTAFTYQGQLENAGNPATGLHDLRFRLYDASADGTQAGATVCFNNVSVTDGLFTVPLDFGAQFTGQERFLEIDVRADTGRDCTNAAGFVVLSPRQALIAAPNAQNADRLDGLDSTAFLQAIPVPLTLTGTTNAWLIKGENAATGAGAASINGTTTGATGATYGGYFLNFSTSGIGVLGLSNATSGTTYGVRGQTSSTAGYGVHGAAIGTTGVNYGVFGSSSSSSGFGVRGTSVDNVGVRGDATGAAGLNYGLYGISTSTDGIGVFGIGSAATGLNYGGYFQTNSPQGIAVYGRAAATPIGGSYAGYFQSDDAYGTAVFVTATARGILAEATSHNGTGIVGVARGDGVATGVYGQTNGINYGSGVEGRAFANTGSAPGVQGSSDSPDGYGVYGYADYVGVYGNGTGDGSISYGVYGHTWNPTGRGVYGVGAASTGTNYGVRGYCPSPSGYAVYANGDLGASGSKSFRIDHPFDPENKYLLHYSAESPMPQNFYVGNVITDDQGYAWVELPDYFAEINANFKYQLTVVDDADSGTFVMAKVSRKIRGSRFQVRTSAPNVEVSWRVDADRNDLYVRNRKPKDVVEKLAVERGRYQHPEFYGQPKERGIDSVENNPPSQPAIVD